MQRVDEYRKPASIAEATALLAEVKGAKLLAGGTDLVIQLNEWALEPTCLIDLSAIPQLADIDLTDQGIRIGSMVTFSRIARHEAIRESWTALAEAAASVAAPQVRNKATIGGNVANGAVAADSVPALMALGALATLVSQKGERQVPVADLMLDLNKTAIREDELLTAFFIPRQKVISAFEKIGRRKAQAISRICLGLVLEMEAGKVKAAQIAVGAAGRRAYLCPDVSALLIGKELDQATISQAALALDNKVADVLGDRPTAPYKRAIAGASLEKALQRLGE